MIAASLSLFTEAVNFQEEDFGILAMFPGIDAQIHSMLRAAVGVVLGLVFIVGMKKVLDRYEDLDETQLLEGGASTQKMILIIVVMTLHSLSEGIGIGVSFGGSSGMKLGQFISLSLAVHNIPEGLAVALVLTSRKMSNIRTGKRVQLYLLSLLRLMFLSISVVGNLHKSSTANLRNPSLFIC